MVSKGRHQDADVASALDRAKRAGCTAVPDKNGHRWGWVVCCSCGARPRRLRNSQESRRFPEPETGEGTVLYSWDRIAAFLREVGDPAPDVPRSLLIADQALRLADAVDGTDVSPGTLRALGLPVG